MSDAILVVNAGSSSIKAALYAPGAGVPDCLGRCQFDGIGGSVRFKADDGFRSLAGLTGAADPALTDHRSACTFLIDALRSSGGVDLIGAGHRVVHGGVSFAEPVPVDDAVIDALADLIPLARSHQPHNLAAIRVIAQSWPDLPQVACFDTAFHRTQSEVAQRLPVPDWLADKGVRGYGFHGLSYQYIAGALPAVAGERARGRTIVAHLGNGASLCAMRDSKCVRTSMRFTPLEGLMMGTRPGRLDPGVVLYLIEEEGMDVAEASRFLNAECGLKGVSGLTNDMRTLLESESPKARLAVDLFVETAVMEVGGLVAALGGLDCLVFTGGIGENAGEIRRRISEGCGYLGADVDEAANDAEESIFSSDESEVLLVRLPTDEEGVIASETERLLKLV